MKEIKSATIAFMKTPQQLQNQHAQTMRIVWYVSLTLTVFFAGTIFGAKFKEATIKYTYLEDALETIYQASGECRIVISEDAWKYFEKDKGLFMSLKPYEEN